MRAPTKLRVTILWHHNINRYNKDTCFIRLSCTLSSSNSGSFFALSAPPSRLLSSTIHNPCLQLLRGQRQNDACSRGRGNGRTAARPKIRYVALLYDPVESNSDIVEEILRQKEYILVDSVPSWTPLLSLLWPGGRVGPSPSSSFLRPGQVSFTQRERIYLKLQRNSPSSSMIPWWSEESSSMRRRSSREDGPLTKWTDVYCIISPTFDLIE